MFSNVTFPFLGVLKTLLKLLLLGSMYVTLTEKFVFLIKVTANCFNFRSQRKSYCVLIKIQTRLERIAYHNFNSIYMLKSGIRHGLLFDNPKSFRKRQKHVNQKRDMTL